MDPARVWPDIDEACILHEDDAVIVVDKPAGVPTQAADPERPDDLVMRLKAFLTARDSAGAYLGVHQRLDRETSGVIVMTRAKEANGSIAKQFEGRGVEKRYVAAVTGWPSRKDDATLRDSVAPGDDGRMQVVSAKARGAQLAVSHVRVLKRQGERALLDVRLETGRTHQARVQLAHARAPIAGDTVYAGAAAPRLMLHARSLTFTHPFTGKKVVYEAKVPAEMEAWLAHGDIGAAIYDDAKALGVALSRARERRFGLGRTTTGPRATTAFRLVNEGGDALPGLAVDVYGGYLVAQFYEDGTQPLWSNETHGAARRERVLDALHALGFDGVYTKFRPKQANVIVDARREEFAPKLPARGIEAPAEMVVLEEGVAYGVRLADGLSTGIFLDQRENRRRLRDMSKGARVLNLFSYTCGFSVAAAAGGASRTVSVDASVGVLERGRENLARLGLLDKGEHTFVAEDVFAWLARAAKKAERFDIVVLDPPSYSNTKKRRFSSESDYDELAAAALAVVAPGGRLLACSNHRGIRQVKLRKFLREAAKLSNRDVAQLKDLPDPLDFPPAVGRESHLKSALVTLSG